VASVLCTPRLLTDVASGTVKYIVAAVLERLGAASAMGSEERVSNLVVGRHFTQVTPVDGARVIVVARGVFNATIGNVSMNASVSPSTAVFCACVVVDTVVITLAAIRDRGSHASVVGHVAHFVSARLKVFALAVESAAIGNLNVQTVPTVLITDVSSAHVVVITIAVVLAAVGDRS
jgi:hypothetical protein